MKFSYNYVMIYFDNNKEEFKIMSTKFFMLLLTAVLSLSSCSYSDTPQWDNPTVTTQAAAQTATPVSVPTEVPSYVLSLDDIPVYSGTAYIVLNNNLPSFTTSEMTTEPFEKYSELDALGRCGVTYANICNEIMPTEERGKIGMIKPSGWHTIRYDFIDGKYLYNRCHLIAYQLAGENDNEKNLITGTRYMNVEGMLPFENKTADYVKSTGNHVLYRVTPIYKGNNLVADGVQMEAKSVEDSGAGLQFNVFCYNAQPGVVIDYTTGDSYSEDSLTAQTTPTQQSTATLSAVQASTGTTYILNTNTKKFHYPSCSSVSNMKDKNKHKFTGSRDEVLNQGYVPCKRCCP